MLAQKAGEEICDLEEAECREERNGGRAERLGPGRTTVQSTHCAPDGRRWMMRENQRVARQYKQQERDRISKLVSPRLRGFPQRSPKLPKSLLAFWLLLSEVWPSPSILAFRSQKLLEPSRIAPHCTTS